MFPFRHITGGPTDLRFPISYFYTTSYTIFAVWNTSCTNGAVIRRRAPKLDAMNPIRGTRTEMKTILVVDDEEMDRILIGRALSHAAYRVLFASDGRKALEVCEESQIDLVITDLVMPNLNGLRLIRRLKNSDPTACILAVSGKGEKNLELAKEAGADEALPKPLEPNALHEAIDELRRVRTLKVDPWRRYWTADELGNERGGVVPSRWTEPV